jgi:hypothetical protein
MKTKELEHGKYYWVRYKDAWEMVDVWQIAKYDQTPHRMHFINFVRLHYIDADSSSIHIDPRPIERERN